MNKKVFFKVFGITTLICILVFAGAFGMFFMNRNVGGGDDLDELDRAVPNQRKNIVVFGTDKSGLRSDVIMIFSVYAKDNSINIMSVPRDTKIKVGKSNQKINAALAIGHESLAIDYVKEVTGIPIHDYATVNFEAVSTIVDALGGVEFDVPQNMNYEDPEQDLYIHLKKGIQVLDGDKAVQLLRFRKYPMADIKRNEVQQEFMKAAFDQKFNGKIVSKIPKIYDAVEENIKSSMSLSEILSYAKMVKKMDSPKVQSFELPIILGGTYVEVDKDKAAEIVNENFK